MLCLFLMFPFIFFSSYTCLVMQFEKEEACRLLKRLPESEKIRADANADMSEDLFEGEKGEDAGDPSVAYGDSTTGSSPKTSSIDKLYIVLIRYRIFHQIKCPVLFYYCSNSTKVRDNLSIPNLTEFC
jgi:hypothetical protein